MGMMVAISLIREKMLSSSPANDIIEKNDPHGYHEYQSLEQ